MKVINPETGFLAYQKIFSNLQANHRPVTVWQSDPYSGERIVTESRLNSYHMESKLLHFQLSQGNKINKSLPLYCYSEDGQMIFKTTVHEIRENVFSVQIPLEIKFLEDLEHKELKIKVGVDLGSDVLKVKRINAGFNDIQVDSYMKVKSMAQRSSRDQELLSTEFGLVSLDEEDRLYADKRESPRARPKADKWVKIRLLDSSNVHRLKLFDLSQGGMGFITFDSELFPKGATIHLMGFEGHDLDDPLVGKVMSHRPMDESQLEWKIGVKFDEGQD